MERWRCHPTHTQYKVSSYGRVKSVWSGKLLKPAFNTGGYLIVSVVGTKPVHRLVLETFVGPRPTGKEAAHKDGNRSNNRLSNLRWRTRSQNNMEKHKHGTAQIGSRNGWATLKEEDIQLIRVCVADGASFSSVAREFKVTRPTITRVINGTTWGHV